MTDKFRRNRRKPHVNERECRTCKEQHLQDQTRPKSPPVMVYDFGDGKPFGLCSPHYERMREPYEPEAPEMLSQLR